jgi:lipopolysaccharide biosynthesis glycosyltransferase
MAAGNVIDIAMSTDDAYVEPFLVTVLSAVRATRSPVRVHLVDSGLSPAGRERIGTVLAPHVELAVHQVPERYELRLAPENYNSYISATSMNRLDLGEILPPGLDRVLYLDADLIVLEDPAELFAADLEGRAVGAVLDAGWPHRHTEIGPDGEVEEWFDGAAPPGYFNSGVLLIDLARWRADGIQQRCAVLARSAGSRLKAPDQDILNMVLRSAWTRLPDRWNTIITALKDPDVHEGDAERYDDLLASQAPGPGRDRWIRHLRERRGIVHYSGRNKPWQDDFPDGPLKDLYREHS